jgi:Flp pilus assembly protein TadD
MARPLVLILLDGWPIKRLNSTNWLARVIENWPFCVLSVTFGVIAVLAQRHAGAMVGTDQINLADRLAFAAYSAMFYPRAMFLHWTFNPLHERPPDPHFLDPQFVLSAAGLIAVTVAALVVRRRWPAMLVAWFSFLVLVAPVSGIAQSGMQIVADRYSYLPCMGFAVLFGGAAAYIWGGQARSYISRLVVALLTVAIVSNWAALAWRQTFVWRDDISLWSHAVQCQPSSIACNNLGWHQWRADQSSDACAQFVRALTIEPDHEKARQNLCMIVLDSQADLSAERLGEAATVLRSVATQHSQEPHVWLALGRAMSKLGNAVQAEQDLSRAAQVDPLNAVAWMRLGQVRIELSQWAGAIDALTRAVDAEDTPVQAWLSLGEARLRSGDAPGAVVACRRATELEPQQPATWRALGFALFASGEPRQAGAAVKRSLELAPDHPAATQLLREIEAALE